MNEAIFLTNEEASTVNCAIEALTDDLLPKYKLFQVEPELIEDSNKRAVGIKINWTMDGEKRHSKEFKKSPCTQTKEGYIAEIKAYLFDVAVATVNLA